MPADSIAPEQIAAFQEGFRGDPQARLALNAVTKNPIRAVALSRAVVTNTDHTYSHLLKSNAVT